MEFTEVGISTEVKDEQEEKAPSPMVLTEVGMVMDVRLEQE